MQAIELSRSMFSDTPEVSLALHAQMHHLHAAQMHMRAAVPAATISDATWAGALVAQETLSSEFIALMKPLTITGRLNLRPAPFLTKFPREITPIGTAGWVGEGKPKPPGRPVPATVPRASTSIVRRHRRASREAGCQLTQPLPVTATRESRTCSERTESPHQPRGKEETRDR